MFKPIFKPAVLGVNYVRKTWTEPKRQVARWLRQELVNYGPVYVKVGQFIAARKDFFPEHLTQELKNLHDNVEPLEYDDIMKVIKDESLDCFADVHHDALSVASIGQVHLATLKQGNTQVVLKIRKPNVKMQIENDLNALNLSFKTACWMFPSNRMLADTYDIINQCETTLLSELDFSQEAKNMVELRKCMQEYNVRIPRIVRSACSSKVLTMEYIPSQKIGEVSQDQEHLARMLSKAVAIVAIKHGMIHGDLHQGNIGIRDGGIVLYDCGSVLRPPIKVLRELFAALILKDVDLLLQVLVENKFVYVENEIGNHKLYRLLTYIVAYTEHLKLDKLLTDISLDDYLNTGGMYFRSDSELLLMSRTAGLLEGSCKELFPQFTYDQVFIDVLREPEVLQLVDRGAILRRGMIDVMSYVSPPKKTTMMPPVAENKNYDKALWIIVIALLFNLQ